MVITVEFVLPATSVTVVEALVTVNVSAPPPPLSMTLAKPPSLR